MFLRVQLLALCFSPCILSLCPPLSTHTLSYTIHLLMTYNYRCCSPDRISELLHSMQSCISDVKVWATVSVLKLNDNKTELMLVTSKKTKHHHNLSTAITIGRSQIPFKLSEKNLGSTLDCHLPMNEHDSSIAWTCCLELRRLASVRRFLTNTATATLVSAFVLSRIAFTATHYSLVVFMM